MMDVNLEYYKIFYYVAKQKSITKAAESLSISQPAVSQAVRNLEKALSCKLFMRMAKGVRLTTEGEVLFSFVEKGYESILAGEKRLAEILDLEGGEICIGASDMTLQFYLLPCLERFHEAYPDIKVTVTNAPTPETMEYLEEGRIDFGVVSTPIYAKHKYRQIPVRKIRDIFVAGHKFEHLKGTVLRYEDLSELPVMCLEGETATRRYVTDFLAEKKVVLQPEFELATSDMLVQFARRSLGIASVVEDFAKPFLESGELFELRFSEELPMREFCIVQNDRIPMSTAAGKLFGMLEKEEI